MSSQQHAAAVILESIHVFRVDLTGARNITRDATLANVSDQGTAIEYTMQGAFINMAGWTNAFGALEVTPFDDNIAMRVVADFTGAVTVYTDLMIALIEKHSVLTSQNSPLAPEGEAIGRWITGLHISVTALLSWLRVFAPTRMDEINVQGKLAQDAFEIAAERYPAPGTKGPDSELLKVVQVSVEVKALLSWYRAFAPTRLDEINAQARLAQDAFELAAARYPRPTARGPELPNVVQLGGEVKVSFPSDGVARK